MSIEERLQRIEDKVDKIEEWIEEEQGIIDTLATILVKATTSGDPNILELLDSLQDRAKCLAGEPIQAPEEPPTLSDLLKMLTDPEVRRGLYIAAQLLKRLGSCS